MVNAKEALLSTDPGLVKRLRGSLSAQIACDTNLLNTELSKKEGGLFVFERISHNLVKTQKEKLLANFDVIQQLHDRLIEILDGGSTIEAEESLKMKM